jgi:hypothetical protein
MRRVITNGVLAAAAAVGCASAASADVFFYQAVLSGAAEAPPNASPGTGLALVDVDTTAHTMRVRATFADLLGTTTASHIHAATPAVPWPGTAVAAWM